MKVLGFVMTETSVEHEYGVVIGEPLNVTRVRRPPHVPEGPFPARFRPCEIVATLYHEPADDLNAIIEVEFSIAKLNGEVVAPELFPRLAVTGYDISQEPMVVMPLPPITLECPGEYHMQLFLNRELREYFSFYLAESA